MHAAHACGSILPLTENFTPMKNPTKPSKQQFATNLTEIVTDPVHHNFICSGRRLNLREVLLMNLTSLDSPETSQPEAPKA